MKSLLPRQAVCCQPCPCRHPFLSHTTKICAPHLTTCRSSPATPTFKVQTSPKARSPAASADACSISAAETPNPRPTSKPLRPVGTIRFESCPTIPPFSSLHPQTHRHLASSQATPVLPIATPSQLSTPDGARLNSRPATTASPPCSPRPPRRGCRCCSPWPPRRWRRPRPPTRGSSTSTMARLSRPSPESSRDASYT